MCPFHLGREYCQDGRRAWQGLTWAVGPGLALILCLTCLYSLVHVLCSCLSARWRELRLSGKDGKPRGYLGPDSSLVQEGIPSDPKWAVWLLSQIAVSATGLFLEFNHLFSAWTTSLGRPESLSAPMAVPPLGPPLQFFLLGA